MSYAMAQNYLLLVWMASNDGWQISGGIEK
jgi:hypothetical protein